MQGLEEAKVSTTLIEPESILRSELGRSLSVYGLWAELMSLGRVSCCDLRKSWTETTITTAEAVCYTSAHCVNYWFSPSQWDL